MPSDAAPCLDDGRVFLLRLGGERRQPAVRRIHNQRRALRANHLLVPVVPELVVVADDVGWRVLVVIGFRRLLLLELRRLIVVENLFPAERVGPFERCDGREVPHALQIGMPVCGPRDLGMFRRRGGRGRFRCPGRARRFGRAGPAGAWPAAAPAHISTHTPETARAFSPRPRWNLMDNLRSCQVRRDVPYADPPALLKNDSCEWWTAPGGAARHHCGAQRPARSGTSGANPGVQSDVAGAARQVGARHHSRLAAAPAAPRRARPAGDCG